MKHIWVVESSGGRKWRPSGTRYVVALFTKKAAKRYVDDCKKAYPGLKWRAVKYAKVGR